MKLTPIKITFDGTAPITLSMFDLDTVQIEVTNYTGIKFVNVMSQAEATILGDALIRLGEWNR